MRAEAMAIASLVGAAVNCASRREEMAAYRRVNGAKNMLATSSTAYANVVPTINAVGGRRRNCRIASRWQTIR